MPMRIEVGRVEALFRYPVKSMRGERLESSQLGWHGLEGDRRLALGLPGDLAGFPWLTATRMPDLLLFTPRRAGDPDGEEGALPTHVVPPGGELLPVFGEALAAEIGRRLGAPVRMMHLRNGVFDDATVSVITSTTAGEVCRLGGVPGDVRRFRPNIVLQSNAALAFEEDAWLGGTLRFGEEDDGPAVAVTARDLRCAMVNHDPDGGGRAPQVLKAVLRANDNHAGIYATVTHAGRVTVGQPAFLER